MSPDPGVDAWDAEAEAFDEAADHGLRDPGVREAWRRLLLDRLPPAPASVADLGCGTGTLSLLLADEGYRVDGVDFSPRMLELAEQKAAGRSGVRFVHGDAYRPPLTEREYDAVLCRHVLWAMPDPALAVRRWLDLLVPGGTLVLVEGRWSNDVGLPAERTVSLVEGTGRTADLTRLVDPVYWGRPVQDERYVVTSRQPARKTRQGK